MKKHFGAKVTPENISKYAQSKHWKENKFENLVHTSMDFSLKTFPKLLYKQFFDKKDREPNVPLEVLPFNKNAFLESSEKMKFIWYGHGAFLLRMTNKTILIDPMMGPNAAPISPFPVKRFSNNTLDFIDSFPEIDLLILTHDHYDHLDYDSIQKLKSKTKNYYVALGVGRHLEKWGIEKELIQEFDWWQSYTFENIHITFTPSRHFSGRGISDRAKSLWGGWVFESDSEKIYFSGDGGYGEHFKEIGKKWNSFDFAFMECGQYNPNWHQIHMYPEEAVWAAKDVNAQIIMPYHWAGFALAQHTWTEPVERFISECVKLNQNFITPQLGEIIHYSENHSTNYWWRNI